MPPGTVHPLRAIGHYSDGTIGEVTNQVTWTTNYPNVAILDPVALTATAGEVGMGNLTATLFNPTFGNVFGVGWLDVSNATLTSLDVSPPVGSYESGMAKGFEVNGWYSDGASGAMTNDVVWTSSNPSVAAVNDNAKKGHVQMMGPGTTTITATLGSVTGSSTLMVTGPALQSVSVSPMNATLQEARTATYQLAGQFADGSSKDLTYAAEWSSSDRRAAIFDDPKQLPMWGVAIALAAGTTTITGRIGNLSSSGVLTVTR